MHEYSIVQSLVQCVEAAVWRTGNHACPDRRDRLSPIVHRIEVRIGELAGVDCDLLATAYDVFRAGTLCENAAMTIDRVSARWQCPKCDAVIERGAILRCARCNEPAQLAAGDEIILQRIELEVA